MEQGLWLLLLCVQGVVRCQDSSPSYPDEVATEEVTDEDDSDDQRKIKGEQYTKHTLLTKVVGGNVITDDFLQMLHSDNPTFPENTKIVKGDDDNIPYLVTEKLQTTITRITIPLSTSFMDSEWYRDMLKKFLQRNKLAASVNNSNRTLNESAPDLELAVLKLWAGATLRDNLIQVLGFLLYHPRAHYLLPADIHPALTHIFNLIKLRRIPLVESLHVLQDISFEDPKTQLIMVFEELERLIPRYLRSCVTYVLEYLYGDWGGELSKVLTTPSGTLVVDLLAGIDSKALLALKQPVQFPTQVTSNMDWPLVDLVGKTMASLGMSISTGLIPVTQQLFGGMLLHLPLDTLTPEVEEYERYLVELVKNKNYTTLSKTLENLEFPGNPYEIVKLILQAAQSLQILNNQQIEAISTALEPGSNTFQLPDYDVMSAVLTSEDTMEHLLRTVVVQEYPIDVVDAKDRLLYYFNKSYVDLEGVNRGFLKSAYGSAQDLLIATLTRIEMREQDLPMEVLETVTVLKAHIIFKKILNNMRLSLTKLDFATLITSFQSPRMPDNVKALAIDIRNLLMKEFNDLQFPPSKQMACQRPRQCVVSVLNVIRDRLNNKTLEGKVKQFLNMVDTDGEPFSVQRRFLSYRCDEDGRTKIGGVQARIQSEPASSTKREIYPGKDKPSPYDSQTHNFPVYVTREGSDIIIFSHDKEILHKTISSKLSRVELDMVPVPNPGLQTNANTFAELLPGLKSKGRLKLAHIMSLLNGTNFTTEMRNANPTQTQGQALVRLLRRRVDCCVTDSAILKAVKNYILVLDFVYKTLPPPPPAKPLQRHIDYPSLLQAIPIPEDDSTADRLDMLKSFFTEVDFDSLLSGLDMSSYSTKGTLLQEILKHLLRHSAVQNNASMSFIIREFQPLVKLTGYGAQPVQWLGIVEKFVSTKNAYLKKALSTLQGFQSKSFPKVLRKSAAIVQNALDKKLKHWKERHEINLKLASLHQPGKDGMVLFLLDEVQGITSIREAADVVRNFLLGGSEETKKPAKKKLN